jgi:signal transduction histidine kinase
MGRLIDDLLKLSRVSQIKIRLVPVDLTALAHNITARLQEEAPDRRIEFIIEPGLTADGDKLLLDLALTNLLDNAVKFTGPRSDARIELGLLKADGCPVFFVRDNGVGFDMTYASKLFGAFQRLHKASEFPGTGIGLATVQRIIHRHGGRIWAEVQTDQGATFYFTLKEAV